MIIDSHHHLWNYNPDDYGWMDDSMHILKQDYLPESLEPLLKKSDVQGTIVVQARQTLEETEWLLELAGKCDFIYGVVGWVDLCSEQLDEQLQMFSNHPKLVGVRHVIHDEPDDNFILREDFQGGIGKLQAFGLVYDLLLFPKHLQKAARLVEAFPEQRFVLDHLGKPPIKSGEIDFWQTELEQLALLPNVYCKLSGMVTEADLVSWKREDFIPYMAVILNSFSPLRVMLGSDWPVCNLGGEYSEVMGISKDFIRELSLADQKLIQYQNAINCYQLQIDK